MIPRISSQPVSPCTDRKADTILQCKREKMEVALSDPTGKEEEQAMEGEKEEEVVTYLVSFVMT